MKARFQVVEFFNGYSLLDTKTQKTAWLGDGVDSLTTPTGKSIRCGTEYFRRLWQESFNSNICETLEAYFSEGE